MDELREARDIGYSIEKINELFESISKILEQENFPEQIVEAKNKIAEYAEQEADTLKEAQNTISEAIEGKSGFFSKKGLNDIIEKISNKSVQQLNTIMTDYANQINEIINSLTNAANSKELYAKSSYSGDEDYSLGDLEAGGDYSDVTVALGSIPSIDIPDSRIQVSGPEFTTSDDTTELGVNAIKDKNLKKITCKNVINIKANAFRSAPNLELIIISKKIKSININAFRGLKAECVIAFEDGKDKIIGIIKDEKWLDGKKIIFDYSDKVKTDKAQSFKAKAPEKPKRVVIKSGASINTPELVKHFVKRNSRYNLETSDVENAINNLGKDNDHYMIIIEALKIRFDRELKQKHFFEIYNALDRLSEQLCEKDNYKDALDVEMALIYLSCSGYTMNESEEFGKQESWHIYFLTRRIKDIIKNLKISYRDIEPSVYSKKLGKNFNNPYYSFDACVEMVGIALDSDNDRLYPDKTNIKKLTTSTEY